MWTSWDVIILPSTPSNVLEKSTVKEMSFMCGEEEWQGRGLLESGCLGLSLALGRWANVPEPQFLHL